MFHKNNRIILSLKARKSRGPQLYTPRERIGNYIWEFTLGDADDQPSVPHAHSKEEGYRLNAWTGDIYPAGTERNHTIGKLRKKDLSKLHNDKGFINFAQKQISWYRTENPSTSFYVPEWFELKYMMQKKLVVEETSENNVFLFFGKANIKSQLTLF